MKFQNPSMHSSKPMLSIKKVCNVKSPKRQRAITQEILFRIYSKVNQVIYSSLPIYFLNFKALSSIVLRYFADKTSSIFFERAVTLR